MPETVTSRRRHSPHSRNKISSTRGTLDAFFGLFFRRVPAKMPVKRFAAPAAGLWGCVRSTRETGEGRFRADFSYISHASRFVSRVTGQSIDPPWFENIAFCTRECPNRVPLLKTAGVETDQLLRSITKLVTRHFRRVA